jgi:hypothetical protein
MSQCNPRIMTIINNNNKAFLRKGKKEINSLDDRG